MKDGLKKLFLTKSKREVRSAKYSQRGIFPNTFV